MGRNGGVSFCRHVDVVAPGLIGGEKQKRMAMGEFHASKCQDLSKVRTRNQAVCSRKQQIKETMESSVNKPRTPVRGGEGATVDKEEREEEMGGRGARGDTPRVLRSRRRSSDKSSFVEPLQLIHENTKERGAKRRKSEEVEVKVESTTTPRASPQPKEPPNIMEEYLEAKRKRQGERVEEMRRRATSSSSSSSSSLSCRRVLFSGCGPYSAPSITEMKKYFAESMSAVTTT